MVLRKGTHTAHYGLKFRIASERGDFATVVTGRAVEGELRFDEEGMVVDFT